MSTLKRSLITALVSATLTAGCLYLLHHRRAAEANSLRSENNRLRMQVLEQHPRVASAEPAASTDVEVRVPARPQQARAASERIIVPIYRDEGNATARAALQTFAWACDQGDAVAVGRMLVFDEAARVKATELFSRMTPEARGTWRSLDEMAAGLVTMNGMSAPFPSADVLERARLEELGIGRVRLHLNGAPRDGTEFQQTADGWKYVITERMVDAYIRQNQGG